MSHHGVWNFLKRKFGLSEAPKANSNASNCTHEDPPSSSLNCNLDALPVVSPTSLKPKRCRMEGPVAHLPSESVEAFAALCQLLTCSVCLEISHQANQCANGHLICLACSAQLEQSAFTAGRACSCPVCRVSLSGWDNDSLTGADAGNPNGTPPGLQRCLLAERLAAELPIAFYQVKTSAVGGGDDGGGSVGDCGGDGGGGGDCGCGDGGGGGGGDGGCGADGGDDGGGVGGGGCGGGGGGGGCGGGCGCGGDGGGGCGCGGDGGGIAGPRRPDHCIVCGDDEGYAC
ncbi:Cysteine and histidine-rich protein 1 [Sparganum proliferum]